MSVFMFEKSLYVKGIVGPIKMLILKQNSECPLTLT